jgi:hypothetical protein
MSSQSVNATTYSGYQLTPTASATPGVGTLWMARVPSRDASDNTRLIREQLRYNEFKTGTPIAPGNTENPWIPYSNGFRLTYLFGKLKCISCSGNALYGNGPNVNNVGFASNPDPNAGTGPS